MAKNIFNTIKVDKPKSNVFDLSHDVKMSFNMGDLVPVCLVDCVPGDKFTCSTQSMIRLAPMIAPVMHKVDVYTHYFFVPNRLVWPNWEKFITNPTDPERPASPHFLVTVSNNGSLADYLGVPPTNIEPDPGLENVSAIPFAAYQCVYNEYYRDQNVMQEIDFTLEDGAQSSEPKILELWKLRKRAWEHDYFTSALPWAQKGDTVEIPLAFQDIAIKVNNEFGSEIVTTDGAPNNILVEGEIDPEFGLNELYADGSDLLDSTSINDLRRAFKIQEWLELAARAGSRYIESILAHFGVRSSDKRLQRPEYIGGSKTPIVISEVLQTSETATSPQGNMAGHGVSFDQGNSYQYFCEEHGYIIGIMSVLPKTAYQQGLPRHFSRKDALDYYWPKFAHIGEQEVLNKELYYGNDGANDDVFGYVPRYAEYKFMSSRVAGDFRDNLAFWHMGRIFEQRPNLNAAFIESNPTKRIFAVEDPDAHVLWAHCFNRIKAVRRMSVFGTPSF